VYNYAGLLGNAAPECRGLCRDFRGITPRLTNPFGRLSMCYRIVNGTLPARVGFEVREPHQMTKHFLVNLFNYLRTIQ